MNRRGLMRMLGLAPLVPVAAVVPVYATGGPVGPYHYVVGESLQAIIPRLDEKLRNYDRAMRAAERVAFDNASFRGSGRLLEPHYWGA